MKKILRVYRKKISLKSKSSNLMYEQEYYNLLKKILVLI